MKSKSAERVRLLERYTKPNAGIYVCPVPGCTPTFKQDGFCPQCDGIPLRLLKARY